MPQRDRRNVATIRIGRVFEDRHPAGGSEVGASGTKAPVLAYAPDGVAIAYATACSRVMALPAAQARAKASSPNAEDAAARRRSYSPLNGAGMAAPAA